MLLGGKNVISQQYKFNFFIDGPSSSDFYSTVDPMKIEKTKNKNIYCHFKNI